jgi:hypothetical protein
VGRLPGFNYNVSHHGGVVALASEPIALVGLDLMHLEHRAGPAGLQAGGSRETCSDTDCLSFNGFSGSTIGGMWGDDPTTVEQEGFFADFEQYFTGEEWVQISRWADPAERYAEFYRTWALKVLTLKLLRSYTLCTHTPMHSSAQTHCIIRTTHSPLTTCILTTHSPHSYSPYSYSPLW